MKFRSALLASAMLALPLAVANAQAVDGLYVGAGAGINIMQREKIQVEAAPTVPGSVHVDIGPAVSASLGWGFGNGLRAEVQGDWMQNNSFSDARLGPPGTAASGKEQKLGVMGNVLYDFVGLVPMVQPYVGIGGGYQGVKWKNVGFATATVPSATAGVTNATKGSFAYQAIAGVAFPIDAVPGLALTAEYRFMGLMGHRTYVGNAGSPNLTSRDDFNHQVLFGLRYAFGVPAAAPAPMPVADMGAKTFLVFFDWDKANLTGRSEGIVRDAATYSTKSQYTRIDVDGNTDTSGTPTYNQGLSERRARVVAAELVRDGVPQNVISMHAYGDTKLLVPTGPNVREPQNRRVEIVFH
jgi:OmpA-OmpF porin, OOP family